MSFKIKKKKEIKKFNLQLPLYSNMSMLKRDFNGKKLTNKLPRIVFLFTLNGRSVRQIFRLFKTIYDDIHFYYFHVDEVNTKKSLI